MAPSQPSPGLMSLGRPVRMGGDSPPFPAVPTESQEAYWQQAVLPADGTGLFISANGLEHQHGHPPNIPYIRCLMVHFRT